ncbi:MAG: hypothetical protein OEY10_05410 [Nitrosopumilus sp.]|nr:hypothetical protein [Nitrosopumilus sp.]
MKKDDGGYVYPQIVHREIKDENSQWGQIVQDVTCGMTYRQALVLAAMQGFIGKLGLGGDILSQFEAIPNLAVKMADLVIAEEKKDENPDTD